MIQLKRGQKRCKSCKSINPVRCRLCKSCGQSFVRKNTPVKNEIKDWRDLEKGTYIRIIQGTGPYFISNIDSPDGQAGEKICLGSTGVYEVISTDNSGIRACGASRKNGGFTYLYMGKPYQSKETGTFLEPYRFTRVKRKQR